MEALYYMDDKSELEVKQCRQKNQAAVNPLPGYERIYLSILLRQGAFSLREKNFCKIEYDICQYL